MRGTHLSPAGTSIPPLFLGKGLQVSQTMGLFYPLPHWEAFLFIVPEQRAQSCLTLGWLRVALGIDKAMGCLTIRMTIGEESGLFLSFNGNPPTLPRVLF